jgi:hypothetical protein
MIFCAGNPCLHQPAVQVAMAEGQQSSACKAAQAAQRRAAVSSQRATASHDCITHGDAELARQLQEQMDLENEQCEHVRSSSVH